ncbi:MAG: hypothetical protein ACPGTU_02240 [Myxococcota bacterium]
MFPSLFLLMIPGLASAQAAESDSFELEASAQAVPTTELDSGWWPEEGAVRVRTVLFAEGVADVEIDGESVVEETAEGGVQSLLAGAGDGSVDLSVLVTASLYLSLDVAGYTWEDVLHEESVEYDVDGSFDSLAFSADGGAEMDLPMDVVEIFSVDQGIIPLVNVVVSGTLTPDASVFVETDSINTSDGVFTASGQTLDTQGGVIELDASGNLEALLNLVVQGHAEVCITWVDCYGDFNYDFPLDPIEHTEVLDYESVNVSHTLIETSVEDGVEEDGESSKSTGCSTLPNELSTSPPMMLFLASLFGLVARRR